MRIGIISDIHGNLEAAKAVFSFYKGQVDCIAVLGDIIGYGPDPGNCIELVAEKAETVVMGNHEKAVIKENFESLRKTARLSLEWTKDRLSASEVAWIANLPRSATGAGIFFVHASVSNPLSRYILYKSQADEEFELLTEKICFFGHTHTPGGFKRNVIGKKTEMLYTDFSGRLDIVFERDCSYLINVGSAGQPRDGFPFACALIYDDTKNTAVIHRIEYPAEITRNKIIRCGLPSVLARRVMQGI